MQNEKPKLEQYYSVKEISESLGIDVKTVRKHFAFETNGVLRHQGPGRYSGKGSYITLMISATALNREKARMSMLPDVVRVPRKKGMKSEGNEGSASQIA